MRNIVKHIHSLILCLLSIFSVAQEASIAQEYPCVHMDKNVIIDPQNAALSNFYASLDSLANGRTDKVSILHIGDSHIQAGIFSHVFRKQMQQVNYFGNGGLGMLFPYKLARTNNPDYFKVHYHGYWLGCKSVTWNAQCNWGVTGINATVTDPNAWFSIRMNTERNASLNYSASVVRVFYPVNERSSFVPFVHLDDGVELDGEVDTLGFMVFRLPNALETVKIGFRKTSSTQRKFVLQGISVEQGDPGVIVHSLGINGASFSTWLKCEKMEAEVKALRPALVVFSLGTNDAYGPSFSPEEYKAQILRMIERIRRACPNTSILLTTPGDNLKKRKYLNPSNEKAVHVMTELAIEHKLAIWDFYAIMGGQKSCIKWKKENLYQNDFLHLTSKGYALQGQLLFDALIMNKYFGECQRIFSN